MPHVVDTITLALRKTIHFMAYAILLVNLVNALVDSGRKYHTPRARSTVGITAVVIALCMAMFDEALQAHSPARTGRASDVAIDLVGIVAGVMVRMKRRADPVNLGSGMEISIKAWQS